METMIDTIRQKAGSMTEYTRDLFCMENGRRLQISVPVFILSLLVFYPIFPTFPTDTLDDTWMYVVNEVLVRRFSFAKDIVFTYGPYAFLNTQQYHPGLFGAMFVCSLLLGSVLFLTLSILVEGRHRTARIVATLLFMILIGGKALEVVFLTLPLLFLVLAVKCFDNVSAAPTHRQTVTFVLMSVALGLVSLIKFTFLIEVGAFELLTLAFLLLRGRWRLGALQITAYVLSAVLFWLMAGQSLADFLEFLENGAQISAGYTDGMSMYSGVTFLLLPMLFLGVCIFYIFPYLRCVRKQGMGLHFVIAGCVLVLFLCFKEGFVRQDMHVATASAALIVVPWLLSFFYVPKRPVFRAVIVCTAAAIIVGGTGAALYMKKYKGSASSVPTLGYPNADMQRNSAPKKLTSVLGNFIPFHQFATCFLGGAIVCPTSFHWLDKNYAHAVDQIRQQAGLPLVRGSVDIYPSIQSLVLATGLKWSPRPVFQSYFAYTPYLEQKNVDHLLGRSAPDNIFFSLSPIDGRLPAMDDALSWPILLTRYRVSERPFHDSLYMLLERNAASNSTIVKHNTVQRTVGFGEAVLLEGGSHVVWATMAFKPSLAGHAMRALLKLPALYITYTFDDGHRERYRIIPAIAEAGFVLSPVIGNKQQFVSLMGMRVRDNLFNREATSFSISVEDNQNFFWDKSIAITLSTLSVR